MKTLTFAFLLIGCLLQMTEVQAKTTASRICLSPDCDKIEIRVNIDSGTDVALPGSFGILAATLQNDPRDGLGKVAYWTTQNGWTPLTAGDLIKPAQETFSHLPFSKEYVIFKGSKDSICQHSRGLGFNVFAWHVGMPLAKFNVLQSFISKYEITGQQAENFMNSAQFFEANKQRKVNLVYTFNCTSVER